MTAIIEQTRLAVALGNRILANEGVLDAFGHVSLRHPGDPNRYFLSRSRAPELVEPGDVLEYDLDSSPVRPTRERLYAERVIHGEIYRARPDVTAVVHHHAAAMMPFCISGEPLVPVMHLGAVIGTKVPFWDQHDEFGNTNLLVVKPEEGASLARALGDASLVLMKGHGATVVGASVQELVFRAVYSCRNAEYQLLARMLGRVNPLRPGEITLSGQINSLPTANMRTWEYWSARLDKSGGGLAGGGLRSVPHARKKKAVGARTGRASVTRGKTKRKGKAR